MTDIDPENAVERRTKETRQNRVIALALFVASPLVYPVLKQIQPRSVADFRLALDALTIVLVPLMAYGLLVASDFRWAPKSWRPKRIVQQDGIIYQHPGTYGIVILAILICSTAFTLTIADAFRSPAAYFAFAVNLFGLIHAILYATISKRIVTITPDGFTDITSAWFGNASLRVCDIRSVRLSADGKKLILNAEVHTVKRRFGISANMGPAHVTDVQVDNLIIDPRDVGWEARDIATIALAPHPDDRSE